jgi:hypothetical protein
VPALATDAPPPVATILAAYERATRGTDAPVEISGTIQGEGLRGTFHTWRSGPNERDDEQLGPRSDTTLRLGDRVWESDGGGNVRELTGILRRRALTEEFIASGAFVRAPERARFVGFGTLGRARTWNVEVTAPGGEPETLWISVERGLPLRTEVLDGDGPSYVDFGDWRDVRGMKIPFRAVTTDGAHAFDLTQQTSSATVGVAIDPRVFEPFASPPPIKDPVQEVPLIDDGTRLSCRVAIAGTTYTFLIDSGSGAVLLDTRVARAAGLQSAGALEVRGAVRSGGLRIARLPRLTIGAADFDDLVVATLDLSAAASRLPLDGILGYPFFAQRVVQLDFAHHILRFGGPGSFEPPGERIPLDTDREIAEAVFGIDGALDAPFIVDTGNAGELLLYAPFVDAHPDLVPHGAAGASYAGVGGANRTYRTQLSELRLGAAAFPAQPADVILAKEGAFADRIDAGNVGLGLLRRFASVTFDFPGHALYLERAAPPGP